MGNVLSEPHSRVAKMALLVSFALAARMATPAINVRHVFQGRLPSQSNCKGLLGSTCAVTPSRDM